MAAKVRKPSPILDAAAATIGAASDGLVSRDSRFRHTFEVPVSRVHPDPEQARKVFAEADIDSLAATMAESGQLQPILLRRHAERRGEWVIVAGERRWRAARRNGWPTLLAIEHDGDPEVAALIENLQRVDLNAVEEARALQRLLDGKGWTQSQAAAALGQTKGEVSATLRILSLPLAVLDEVLTSELELPRNALVELARIEDPAARAALIAEARRGALTIKAIRAAKEPRPGGEAPGREPGAPRDPPSVRFSMAVLDRLAERLRGLRVSREALSAEDRARLVRLREEIDELLRRRD